MAATKACIARWKKANPEKLRAQSRRYYEKHRDQVRARSKARRVAHPANAALAQKKKDLRRLYGISFDEYERMLVSQEYRCAICRAHQDDCTLCVDHHHDSGAVRGLLCSSCNSAIGLLHESVAACASAMDYLNRFCAISEAAL